MVAAVGPLWGTQLFSRPVLLEGAGAEGGHVSAVTPDRPPVPLPLVLVGHGLEFCIDLDMRGHILAGLNVLTGTHAILRMGVAGLPALVKPSHEATDDAQAGHPAHVMGAGHGAWLCLWVWLWLLMRKMQGLGDVTDPMLLMRMLQGLVNVRFLHLFMQVMQGLVDVRVCLGIRQWS